MVPAAVRSGAGRGVGGVLRRLTHPAQMIPTEKAALGQRAHVLLREVVALRGVAGPRQQLLVLGGRRGEAIRVGRGVQRVIIVSETFGEGVVVYFELSDLCMRNRRRAATDRSQRKQRNKKQETREVNAQ